MRHGHPRLAAGVLDARDQLSRRAAEGERDHGGTLRGQELELRVPIVVVVAGVPDRRAGPLRGAPQAIDEGLVAPGGRGRPGDEDVHPERRVGQPAHLRDPLAQRVGAEIARGQEPEPAGAADGGGELGRGRAAGQRRQDHRMLEALEDHPARR